MSQAIKNAIHANFVEFPSNWQSIAPFCVDGRNGDVAELYPQALGGSLNIVAVKTLLEGDLSNFNDNLSAIFSSLKDAGFVLGVHGDDHAPCGCGFCNNLAKIITRLKSNKEEIFKILKPHIGEDQMELWNTIMNKIAQAKEGDLPEGEETLTHAKSIEGVSYQTLTGKHQEQVAVVNLIEDTTLDVDRNQNHQAFNLDLWYVEEQAKALNINVAQARLLTLGLYVATEMVLVEDSQGERLPILIHQ